MTIRKIGFCLAAGLFCASQAQAVEIWHSNTVWANMGMCSATFSFDSGTEPVGQFNMAIELVDTQGTVVSKDVIAVEPFGDSEATRYQIAYGEGEHYCDDNLTVKITAISDANGNALPLQMLTPRDFTPMKIVSGANQ